MDEYDQAKGCVLVDLIWAWVQPLLMVAVHWTPDTTSN